MTSALRPSIEYIPEGIRDEPLYQTVCVLIDAVRVRPVTNIVIPLTDTVRELIPTYDNELSVLAYYNMFIRPSIGTLSALEFILQLLSIDADLVEWFKASFNLPAYKFTLDFTTTPENLQVGLLIDLVNEYRSERSRLAVIREVENFRDLFVLDSSLLDDALLDDVSGTDFKGVNVFLGRTTGETLVYEIEPVETLQVTVESEQVQPIDYSDWRLDYYLLGDPPSSYDDITAGQIGTSGEHFTLPRYSFGEGRGSTEAYIPEVNGSHTSV